MGRVSNKLKGHVYIVSEEMRRLFWGQNDLGELFRENCKKRAVSFPFCRLLKLN